MKTLIQHATIFNEGTHFKGSVLIVDDKIGAVYPDEQEIEIESGTEIIDASGLWLLPGAIDDQVHFREPGFTWKGDMFSESRAAVAGGVTTFMDMPNTRPTTTTIDALEWKFSRAAETSAANYSFFFGGTNDNLDEVHRLDRSRVPGLKLFLGSSTGDLLVDNVRSLEKIFAEAGMLIAIHAESNEIIERNRNYYVSRYGENLGAEYHPLIRSEEACYASSSQAVELAERLGTRLHILHLSTAKELSLLSNKIPLKDKQITGEVCIHHLWFSDEDYNRLGNRIKWNPAIKSSKDRTALRAAVADDTLDIVATDHAPHLLSEKEGSCLTAASGGPLIQHSLLVMLELANLGFWNVETVVNKMSHCPADLFHVDHRGYIRKDYYADLVLVDPSDITHVTTDSLFSKCGWSPFEGITFKHKIRLTFVNGKQVYDGKSITPRVYGREIKFKL